ncbi:MAG: LamG-like jellyroll fold domain-containing protein [bacterium]
MSKSNMRTGSATSAQSLGSARTRERRIATSRASWGYITFLLLVPAILLLVASSALATGSIAGEDATNLQNPRLVDFGSNQILSSPTDRGRGVILRYYYDDSCTYGYGWPLPQDSSDWFAVRFDHEESAACTLSTVRVKLYRPFMAGTPDLQIGVYDDDGSGLPGTLLATRTVPYASLPPEDFGWAEADFAPLILGAGEGFHIGITTIGGVGDTLCPLSDAGTGPHAGEDRSETHYPGDGLWYTLNAMYGLDYVFMIEAEMSCAQTECVPPPSGMVAWWHLDEMSGPTANDIAGSVNNSGTWINSPVPVTGKVDGALSFNESNSVDVPDDPELNFGTGDFSIDMWIKSTDASASASPILDKRTGSGSNITGYALYLYNGYLGSQIGDGTGYLSWTSTGFVADGNWHHIAITIDRDEVNGWRYYVDGSIVGTPANPTAYQGSLTNTAPLVLARNLITPSQTFAGTLDEIELFNRVLDPSEIYSIWAADSLGKCKDLPTFIGHFMTPEGAPYPFDVTISDGEWVQKFDDVTYINTTVPLEATYTYSYIFDYGSSNHKELGHAEFSFSAGEVREFEFYAIDPAGVEECTRPYFCFRELGACDSLEWDWNPGENRVSWSVVGESDRQVGLKIWSDADALAPVDKYAVDIATGSRKPVWHWSDDEIDFYVVKVEYQTINIDLNAACDAISGAIIWSDFDPDNTALGVRNVLYNGASMEAFSTSLRRSDGTPVDAEFMYPQYSVPPPFGSFAMAIDELPEGFASLEIPLFISHEQPQIADVYPPKLAELQPDTFIIVAENSLANSSYSDLDHSSGDSIAVNVSTENLRDWWGCFVLPDSLTAGQIVAYSGEREVDTLSEGADWLDNLTDAYNLVTVRIRSSFNRLVLKPTANSCCQLRGDIDHNGSGPDIADLVFLVNYMFNGGSEPPCMEEADVNGDSAGPDIADLVYLVNYMFNGGPAPILCGQSAPKLSGATPEVSIELSYDGDFTTVTVNSETSLLGLQLEMETEASSPQLLADDGFELYSFRHDSQLRIGCLDLEGMLTFPSGRTDILRLPGKGGIIEALVTDRSFTSIQPAIIVGKSEILPCRFELDQNYPNPFNPVTRIGFSLPEAGAVRLEIFNIVGQRVTALVDDVLEAGHHQATWDASDQASGVYFYRITSGQGVDSKKMLLLK